MKITMPDGSPAEISAEEFEAVADIMGWKPVPEKPKTQGELLRAALDEAKGEAVVDGRNGEPPILTAFEAQLLPEKDDNDLPAPAKMPHHVEPTPVAHVTQAQALVIELLRHHPLGLKTKEIAEKLRWDHPKATRQTTALERGMEGMPKLVRRVPGHYRYALTKAGQRSAFKIVGQPARMREKVST